MLVTSLSTQLFLSIVWLLTYIHLCFFLDEPTRSTETLLSIEESADKPESDVFIAKNSNAFIAKIVDKELADDHDDDMLLREQLLQALACKRADKAKAMLAVSSRSSSVCYFLYRFIAAGKSN